jgi:hypothetical protein
MKRKQHEIDKIKIPNEKNLVLPRWFLRLFYNILFLNFTSFFFFKRLQKLKNETFISIFDNEINQERDINVRFTDLEELNFLGSGQFGTVKKMRIKSTNIFLAVKVN